MQIEVVSPFVVDSVWGTIAPLLAKALERNGGGSTPDLLWQACRTGQSNLLIFHEDQKPRFYVILTFETWAGERVAYVNVVCGANLKSWQAELPNLEDWCKMHGAKAIMMGGSKAYKRVFRKAKPIMTIYRMEIDNG